MIRSSVYVYEPDIYVPLNKNPKPKEDKIGMNPGSKDFHNGKEENELRKYKRYALPDDTFFAFDHESDEMAVIENISSGGLKLEYTRLRGRKSEWKTIAVFIKNPYRPYIFRIPCKIIYRIDTGIEVQPSKGIVSCCIAGLKFGTLTAEQERRLRLLLDIARSSINN